MSSTGAARDQWMARLRDVQIEMARAAIGTSGTAVPSPSLLDSFRPVAERILTALIGPPPPFRWDGRMASGSAVGVRQAGVCVDVVAYPDTGSAYVIPLLPEVADDMAEALTTCAEAARHARPGDAA